MKNRIHSKIQNGYTLDIGTLIDDSLSTFKKTFLISGVALLILGILFFIIYAAIFGLVYGFSDITNSFNEYVNEQSSGIVLINTILISALISAFFAPITAGFIHANHLAKKEQEIGFNVFFDFYKSLYFKDIFKSYLIIGLTTGVINASLILLELSFLSYIFQFIISIATVFTLPLIIYGNENYEKAILKSFQLSTKQPFIIFIALLLAVIGMLIGIIGFCIGIIFTVPYYYAMIYAIYNQAIGFDEDSLNENMEQVEY